MKTVSRQHRFVSNENGSVIISILVLSTVMLVFGLGLMTSLNDSFNLNTFAHTKVSQMKMEGMVKSALQNGESCNKNFTDSVLDKDGRITLTQLQGKSGEQLLAVNQTLGTKDLQVKDISINTESAEWLAYQAAKASATVPIPLESKLRIRYQKLKTAMGSKQSFTDIPVHFLVDKNQKISVCDTSDSTGQTLCLQLGGVFDTANKKCQFNNCANLPDGSLPSGACVKDQLSDIQKNITTAVEAEQQLATKEAPMPETPTLPASSKSEPSAWKNWSSMVKSCVQTPQGAQFSGTTLSCQLGSFSITANATSVQMSAGAMSYTGGPDDSVFIMDQVRGYILSYLAATQ
ncbi:hypothetical protein [Bdellovibrio sp. HCB209]|uniref:hypothetical protein n=1 Tax=Bdellovibrio sp. HCB209 TaxID=3394354 RepID=UPI0039B68C82